MAENGFIRDLLDVKVLILYVMNRVEKPISVQDLYALCYQDDRLTYFDVFEAAPQLVTSGHLAETAEGLLQITEKGRRNIEITADSVAFPVRERAKSAVDAFNREVVRSGRIHTQVLEENGAYRARMELSDAGGTMMTLELAAPGKKEARRLALSFSRCAERLYEAVMEDLLDSADG